MSKALELLEKLGEGKSVSTTDIEQANLSEGIRNALLNRDKAALELALGSRTQVFCGVHDPDEDDNKDKKITLAVNAD